MAKTKSATNEIDNYIAGFPEDVQKLLQQLRTLIKKAAPEAEEVLSYAMPAYGYHGMLVYFAGCKNHIGFYPTGEGISAFKKELADFKGSKGSVHFPLDKPLPNDLIAKIVEHRVAANLEKERRKAMKKKAGKV